MDPGPRPVPRRRAAPGAGDAASLSAPGVPDPADLGAVSDDRAAAVAGDLDRARRLVRAVRRARPGPRAVAPGRRAQHGLVWRRSRGQQVVRVGAVGARTRCSASRASASPASTSTRSRARGTSCSGSRRAAAGGGRRSSPEYYGMLMFARGDAARISPADRQRRNRSAGGQRVGDARAPTARSEWSSRTRAPSARELAVRVPGKFTGRDAGAAHRAERERDERRDARRPELRSADRAPAARGPAQTRVRVRGRRALRGRAAAGERRDARAVTARDRAIGDKMTGRDAGRADPRRHRARLDDAPRDPADGARPVPVRRGARRAPRGGELARALPHRGARQRPHGPHVRGVRLRRAGVIRHRPRGRGAGGAWSAPPAHSG